MKKALYILTILLTMSNMVKAQDDQQKKIILGIRGGLTLAPSDWEFSHIDIFPTVGFAASFSINKKMPLYFETGLYYTNRYLYDDFYNHLYDNSYSCCFNNHSLLIPELITYHIPIKKDKTIQPFIGPFIAYGFNEADFDAGLRLGVGYCSKKIYINCGYDISKTYGVDEDALFFNIGYNL